MKPITCKLPASGLNTSQPSDKLTTQIPSVLHVSIVDLAVALTLRVTLKPKKLKSAMDKAIAKLE